ncbi:histidine phosphatase family protein [Marinomonas mediterranea]|jgi:Fructose-2,6-bisphosphatase|uniref:Phosphoglycerate mutase n=1 Tax=Marinomonas mediterranea (strain ATCC 700492 / JCM 21426 / NBRC 103028 / MMB-1) TaxID=717774 RepID=F2K2Z0_MARM1|nr:histidine phosphatase family protein [Marinomonas mediterranea]ADZ92379.1 Phosphoglycerate mutase [Marinomonas mediterranea MMB-1]WCN18428.1 phosphoglycerate mutase [Marinomonas mediterranea MMB-1]
MKLFLVRHPEPDVEKGFCYGKLDVPIVSSWHQDAVYLSQWLERRRLPKIQSFHSPLSRASKLALSVNPNSKPIGELAELDFGLWEGQNWSTISREEIDEWGADLQFSAPYKGESLEDLRLRVMPKVNALIDEADSDIVLYTHSGVIKVIVSVLCQWPVSECHRINIGYSSVTQLTINDDRDNRYISLDLLGAGDWVGLAVE